VNWTEKILSLTKPGDVVLIDLDPIKGGEKGKRRPCLVLVGSGHPWKILIVVPITDSNNGTRSKKLFVAIPHPDSDTGLSKESCIDCFQIRCLDESRILKKLGEVQRTTLDEALARIGAILSIGEEHIS
jgi:mRNA interferase MazF